MMCLPDLQFMTSLLKLHFVTGTFEFQFMMSLLKLHFATSQLKFTMC